VEMKGDGVLVAAVQQLMANNDLPLSTQRAQVSFAEVGDGDDGYGDDDDDDGDGDDDVAKLLRVVGVSIGAAA
jgi:hypothetical protein